MQTVNHHLVVCSEYIRVHLIIPTTHYSDSPLFRHVGIFKKKEIIYTFYFQKNMYFINQSDCSIQVHTKRWNEPKPPYTFITLNLNTFDTKSG